MSNPGILNTVLAAGSHGSMEVPTVAVCVGVCVRVVRGCVRLCVYGGVWLGVVPR